jgi:MFS family permease
LRQAAGGLPRTFWLLWTGTLINRLGAFVVIFLAIYLTGERGFTQSQAGLVIGLHGAGGAIGTMVGGVLADRWGRRPTLLTAQFGAATLMLGLGFAHEYGEILAAAFLLGIFAEGARPAFSAMMIDVVPERDRVRAFSLNYWAINLGFAVASVGAGLAAQFDYLLLFVVDAATTLATALIGLLFLTETRPSRPAGQRTVTTVPGGLGTVFRDRVYIGFLLLNLGAVLVMFQHMSTLPIAMSADGLGPATFGWVIAVNGVLIVAGQLFVPRLIAGHDRSRVLSLATLIVGIGFGLVAFADSAWFFAVTVIIWTLGEMLQSPSNSALIAELSPAALRGRYQGVNSLSWSVGAALAPIAGGFVQEHLGDATLWLGCAGLGAAVALAQLLSGPARERRIAALRAVDMAIAGSGGSGAPAPSVVSPSAGSPAAGSPAAGSPAAGSPAAGPPDAGSPALAESGAPAERGAVDGPPAAAEPVVAEPVVVTEPPAVAEPVADAPPAVR